MRLNSNWVVGFVDGEGSFQATLLKSKGLDHFLPYSVCLKFAVSQAGDRTLLTDIQQFFGSGKVRENLTHKGNFELRVTRPRDLKPIRDFFQKHPLKTMKQRYRFRLWSQILDMVLMDTHFTEDGLLKIAKLREKMNLIPFVRLGRLKYRYEDIKNDIKSFFKSLREDVWTEEETDFLKRNYVSMRALEIARKLKRSYHSVVYMARELNLQKRTCLFSKNLWREEEIQFLKENYFKLTKQAISQKLGRTKPSVYSKARKVGIQRLLA